MENSNDASIRLAILVDNDRTWTLSAWIRTLPRLTSRYNVVGLWEVEQRLGKVKQREIPRWYIKTFGLAACGIFGAYSLRAQLRNHCSGVGSMEALAHKCGVPFFQAKTPNESRVAEWMKENSIDVGVIMLSNILRRPLIESVRIGIINKHAACLPSCRGLFPYFWGVLRGEPLGVSYHVVNEGIDEGTVLLQKRWEPTLQKGFRSMLRFYIDVFDSYAVDLIDAISRLISDRREVACYAGPATYYGLPTTKDVAAFRDGGHSMAHWRDLFYKPRSDNFLGAA